MADISAIVPARRAAATIGETLRSIGAGEPVLEIVVVMPPDDHATRAAVRAIADPRVVLVDGPPSGIAAATNAGLGAARGRFVAKIDADDLVPPGRFARQRDWLEAHPGHVAVSGGFRTITASGRAVADLCAEGDGRDVTDSLLDGRAATHLGTFLVRAGAAAETGFRDWFQTAEDLDFQFRLAALGPVWHQPVVSYLYRLHDASITHTQPGPLRLFYERSACEFARQRQARGSDDLAAGRPPEPPAPTGREARPDSAAQQAAGHLQGAAWRLHAEGFRGRAVGLMLRSVLGDPADLSKWRSLGALVLRPAGRRRSPAKPPR